MFRGWPETDATRLRIARFTRLRIARFARLLALRPFQRSALTASLPSLPFRGWWLRQQSFPEFRGQAAAPGLEDAALALVHQGGLDRVAVVVADQVEHTVGDEQIQLGRERNLEAARLARGRLRRDHDLPDEWDARRLERERQHIGPPGDAPVPRVETPNFGVVDDEHVHVARRATGGREGAARRPHEPRRRDRHCALAIRDRDGHHAGVGGDPRSPLRASCASYARTIADTS